MSWTFEDFEAELNDLDNPVREKAIAIAIELLKAGHHTEEEAIKQGIKEAKEWYIDRQA